jgi:hypothetical protein
LLSMYPYSSIHAGLLPDTYLVKLLLNNTSG